MNIRRTTTTNLNNLDKYRPLPEWFAHNPYGIHGIGHVARVFVWANIIGRQLLEKGTSLNLEAIHWASALHDVGRHSDGIDKGHGARSADWVAEHRDMLPAAISDDTLNAIVYCCLWHDTADRNIPIMTPELICLKDADGLDRVRINDLNPDLLRSEPARLLVLDAWDLYHASEGAADAWDTVMKCADRKGHL